MILVIRILLLMVSGMIIFYSVQNQFVITAVGFALLVVFQIYLLMEQMKSQFADIEKSVDCLLHDDYSNVLSAEKRKNVLHDKTALLYEKYRDQHLEQSSEQLIFDNIIESLSIGILILKRDQNQQIQVFKINKAFTDFLKIPKYYQWDLLQGKITALTEVIDMKDWQSIKHVISLAVNDEMESFFLKTSVTSTYGCDYMILTLETVQQLINKKEKESWFKLMNVMSHEIINTITPISSLAGNLETLLKDEPNDAETLQELETGLSIINKRSAHLTDFVDTYRKLTELPLPEKERTDLTTLISQTLTLFQSKFNELSVEIQFDDSESQMLFIDQHQIEQVFINLFSNSLHALENTAQPQIKIEVQQDKHRTQVTISDNGSGIPKDLQDKIFIPYFTTRKTGSGIGLTLTKSIMEAHGGGIHLKRDTSDTSFVLVFMHSYHL
ncbi:GHKL domain-containing protein [bacterium SCSIO 12643]|nr:GHKL domain-containing protein [bacterium SCSIO 12643]